MIPHAQHRLIKLAFATIALGSSVFFAPLAAAETVLFFLGHGVQGTTNKIPVKVVAGIQVSPQRGQAKEKWTVRPGDSVHADAAPSMREVELHRGTSAESSLLCRLRIKYFRATDGGWVPHFQLDETPLVVWRGNRWQPLTTVQGAPSLIVLTSSTLPNADGFSPALEFGLTTGPVAVDFWVVR